MVVKLGRGLAALFTNTNVSINNTSINDTNTNNTNLDNTSANNKETNVNIGIVNTSVNNTSVNNTDINSADNIDTFVNNIKDTCVNFKNTNANNNIDNDSTSEVCNLLNPIAIAESIKQLMIQKNYSQEKVANLLKKSKNYVATLLKLLTLPESVQQLLRTNRLSLAHAKYLLNIKNVEEIANKIVNEEWTVKDTQEYLKNSSGTPIKAYKNEEELELEQRIEQVLHVSAKISMSNNKGKITLMCKTYEELELVIGKLINN